MFIFKTLAEEKGFDDVYSRPHFMEDGPGYIGKRLNRKLLREEQNPDLIKKIRRSRFADDKQRAQISCLFFLGKATSADRRQT
jgi:hypothetical protein